MNANAGARAVVLAFRIHIFAHNSHTCARKIHSLLSTATKTTKTTTTLCIAGKERIGFISKSSIIWCVMGNFLLAFLLFIRFFVFCSALPSLFDFNAAEKRVRDREMIAFNEYNRFFDFWCRGNGSASAGVVPCVPITVKTSIFHGLVGVAIVIKFHL